MTGMLVCLSAAVLGVDFGWQPLTDGGIEYIIQIEPQMLESLQGGEGFTSALPPSAHNIRRYRIVVGTAPLPHHGEPLPVAPADEAPPSRQAPEEPEASRVGYDEALERTETPDEVDLSVLGNMPIESPYPRNYEQAGIPLPGPVFAPSLVVQDEPRLPEEEPFIPEAQPEEPETFDAHNTGKPLAKPELPAEESPREASPPRVVPREPELGPRPKQQQRPSFVRVEPPAKGSSAPRSSAKNEAEKAREEPHSPSDQRPAVQTPSGPQNSLALVGLFASLGGNAFLVWVTSGQRNRYRALLRRSREALAAASADDLPQAREEDDAPHWETVAEEVAREEEQ